MVDPGARRQEINEAILDAFDVAELERALSFRLDKRLDRITLADDFDTIVFEVVTKAERQNWLWRLLDAVHHQRPDDERLAKLAEDLGLSALSREVRAVALERMVVPNSEFLDIAELRTKLAALEGQVCGIKAPGPVQAEFGTGFLVGPDLLLTNYHVVEKVVAGATDPARVELRFDYKVLADGVTEVNKGTTHRLAAAGWLVDASPQDAAQSAATAAATGGPPAAGPFLDYALLRLHARVGEEPVNPGSAQASPDTKREWVRLPDPPAAAPAIDDPVFVVQHPQFKPLKVALNTQSYLGVFGDGSRIRHRTNTESGSSGSPCFDQHWNLIALHCGGDSAVVPAFNEAVPLGAILARLPASVTGELRGPA